MDELFQRINLSNLRGDKTLWGIIIITSLISILGVYSASSNLEFIGGEGTTLRHVLKHFGFIVLGCLLMAGVQRIDIRKIGNLGTLLLCFFVILLAYVAFYGTTTISGASASRWLRVPFLGISFQPSNLAYLFLIVHLCKYLTSARRSLKSFWYHMFYIFLPIVAVTFLVIKDNGSTGGIILLVSFAVLILGQYNWRYLIGIIGVAFVLIAIFLLVALNTNWIKSNRVDTWKSRIENYSKKNNTDGDITIDVDKDYQIMQARAALVHGGLTGKGPGKSAMKQMLPQSASDFIFAIIVEEYGFFGALALLLLYFIILMRIMMIARKTHSPFATLLAVSIGVMFFVQVAVNISVSLQMMPVTGQPLPFMSYGGTSILVTFIQLGLVLNISSNIQVLTEEGHGTPQKIKNIQEIA